MARIRLFTRRNLIFLLSTILIPGNIYVASAAPEGGAVRAGSAQITQQGSSTLIRQSSPRAVIDWRSFGINAGERVQFSQPTSTSATLNRVTGEKVSVILGRMDANGQVFLINPNGIIFGKGAQINVGSLIASTSNLSNDNFMQGRLIFDQPGRPGAGIANLGSITAAEGGLIALVAPHVRNDGIIQARLGKVVLGAADTFTIDFYGDGLINIALSEASLSQLRDSSGGALIEQAGTIDVSGGRAVLVSAEAARGMLDSLINMSGTIIADSAVQQGGSIVLLARGGSAQVSGTLSARGTTGGLIEVLGGKVHLTPGAILNADGLYGGGVVHVGGAWQGAEGTYRSQFTQIDPGSFLTASAIESGNGGEVVAWSDKDTIFSGSILARGGALSGNGGMVEVSGKGQLSFYGLVDAGAAYGKAGSLLLDPYDLTLGSYESGLVSRVLSTGTSVSLSADHDINVNYAIDGRGRASGGGVTLSAGHDINLNDYLVTSNGAINLFAAAGTVRVAPGKVVYAGTAPIAVRSGSTLYSAPYLTGGRLTLASTLGSVNIDYPVESFIGDLVVQALADVNVNQPVVSLMDGNSVSVTAGNSINVNALVDGRPAFGIDPVGTVTMTAGQNINLSKSIIAHDINITATAGTITSPTMKDGTVTIQSNGIPLGEGLFAGAGPISVTAGSNLSSGIYVTTGPVSIRSTGGNINVDTKLAEVLGDVTIRADSGSVNVDQEIANIRSGHNLTVAAGTNINQNSIIDALKDNTFSTFAPIPGGSVSFAAGGDVNLNRDLVTYNGPVNITATTGTLNFAWDNTLGRSRRIQIYEYYPNTSDLKIGAAPITVTTGGNLSTGTKPPTSHLDFPVPWDTVQNKDEYIIEQLKRYVTFSTTGKLSLTSTGGNVTVDAPIPDTTGEVAITAANAIVVNHKVLSDNQPITLAAGAGGITLNGTDDYYGLLGGGFSPSINSGSAPLTLQAVGDIYAYGNGITTEGKLTIDTRSKIKEGFVYPGEHRPSEIALTADQGIDSFYAGYSPKISANSLFGDIHLAVNMPGQLFIEATQGSVFTGFALGPDVTIRAGTDINLSSTYGSGVLKLTAKRDANLDIIDAVSLDLTTGRNANFNFTRSSSDEPHMASLWFVGGGLNVNAGYQIGTDWNLVLDNGKPVPSASGGNINFSNDSAIHIEDPAIPYNSYGLTLRASNNVTLGLLETFGPVDITAQTGNITLRNDIGGPIQYNKYYYTNNGGVDYHYADSVPIFDHTPGTWNFYKYEYIEPPSQEQLYTNTYALHDPPYVPSLDPDGVIGVKSLVLNAGDYIMMQGAKAVGEVTINAGGSLTASKGIYSGISGGVNISTSNITVENVDSYGSNPLDVQAQLLKPAPSYPMATPGPAVSPPGIGTALTALPAQPPGLASAPDTGIPSSSGSGAFEQDIDAERTVAKSSISEVVPEEETDEDGQNKKLLHFSGGRGLSQEADLKR